MTMIHFYSIDVLEDCVNFECYSPDCFIEVNGAQYLEKDISVQASGSSDVIMCGHHCDKHMIHVKNTVVTVVHMTFFKQNITVYYYCNIPQLLE